MARRKKGDGLFIVSFLAPAVILYTVFVVVPLIQSFYLSLYRWKGASGKKTFLGLENFSNLAHDNTFLQALGNNIWLLVVCGFVVITVGVMVAHTMQGDGKMAKVVRGVVLFPQVVSLVVVAALWGFLYDPVHGLLTSGLKALNLNGWIHPWLGDAKTALPCVAVTFIWNVLGFYVLLFAAGIQGIPSEVREAAELDGSAGLHRFWKVTWPMLWSVKRVAGTYIVINVMNVFTLIYMMTNGGDPDHHTEVTLSYLYTQSFGSSHFGYGAAIAVASFIASMTLSVLVLFVLRRDPQEAKR